MLKHTSALDPWLLVKRLFLLGLGAPNCWSDNEQSGEHGLMKDASLRQLQSAVYRGKEAAVVGMDPDSVLLATA